MHTAKYIQHIGFRLAFPVLFCVSMSFAPPARSQEAAPKQAPGPPTKQTQPPASAPAPIESRTSNSIPSGGNAPSAKTSANPATNDPAGTVPAGTFIHVNLEKGARIAKLKAGSEFNGEVSQPVYLVDREVIPQGGKMRFVVSSVEKRPLPTRAFTDRISEIMSLGILKERQTILHLRSAQLQLPGGAVLPVNATVVRASEIINVRAAGNTITLANGAFTNVAADIPSLNKAQTAVKKIKEIKHPALTLSLNAPLELPGLPLDSSNAPVAGWNPGRAVTVRSGTPARLLLLTKLDANKSHVGDSFEARLTKPIVENGEVLLPEGARFYGEVTRVKHATIGRRSAALLLRLDRVAVGNGPEAPISASLTSVETDEISRLRMDDEGQLKPRHPSKTELARDIALAWVPGKGFNDSIDSLYPFTANFGGLALWAGMFMIHKGHDVYIPADTEIQMTFSRDCVIPAGATAGK
jgi:hypothetical protein